MLRLSLLWGFALMLMPALLIQGWWVKKRAIRMGPAYGPSRGFAAEEKNQSRKRDGATVSSDCAARTDAMIIATVRLQ